MKNVGKYVEENYAEGVDAGRFWATGERFAHTGWSTFIRRMILSDVNTFVSKAHTGPAAARRDLTLLPIASDFTHFGNFGGMGNKGERDGFSVCQVRGCSVLMRLRSPANDVTWGVTNLKPTPPTLSLRHPRDLRLATIAA